jgi:antitoxin component YwqK of YwqJK toxin-antitoxin module
MAKTTSKKPAKVVTKGSPHTIHHKDGSIYAKGQMLGGKMHGYWEFYRKDGSIMRSGSFDREQQIGTWTTYDSAGTPVKVTEMKTDGKSGSKAADSHKTAPKPQSHKRTKETSDAKKS